MNNIGTHPRERLVKTAAHLVHRQGWTITGINQILTEAGIPKGSFYYYFRSKEALGLAVLQHHHVAIKELLERTLLNASLSVDEALAQFIRELQSGPRAEEFRYGCPAGNLAGEIATQCPALLTEANRTLELYRDAFAGLATRAGRNPDPAHAGRVAVMLLQGALLNVKASASREPLDLLHAALAQLLLKDTTSGALTSQRALGAA